MTKGFKEAAARMALRADILTNRRGRLYDELSQNMQDAIRNNHDSSYNGSKAVTVAVQSAQNWQHATKRHINNIMAPTYANYRQYGCGDLAIAILVQVTEHDNQENKKEFAKVLHNPEALA
jgi:hypothetical protein